jgi:hypothetical protein
MTRTRWFSALLAEGSAPCQSVAAGHWLASPVRMNGRVPESSASSAASSAALTLGTRRANCCTFVDDRLALRRAEPAVGPSASSSQQQSAAGWLRGLCPVAAGLARAIPTRLGPGARGPGGQAASAVLAAKVMRWLAGRSASWHGLPWWNRRPEGRS